MKRFMRIQGPVRSGVVGALLVFGVILTGCEARGGGYLDAPLPSGINTTYSGRATFGFTFTCEVRNGTPVVRGQLEYHDTSPSTIGTVSLPSVALHGVVEPIVLEELTSCQEALQAVFPSSASFAGTYRPQQLDPAIPDNVEQGTFLVQVFDQGEPGRSEGEITGDLFSINLEGGPYAGYTRAGYIAGGNIQVR